MTLKPWQTLLVLLVFGGLFAGAFRAGNEWRRYQAPDMLRVSHAGELYIQALDRIFVFAPDGAEKTVVDLAAWGIRQSTGGFDVFSNGDLLLLEGTHQQGPLLQLLTFLRMEKLLLQSEGEATGRRLLRCSPASGQCVPLPALARRFESTFRVQLDAQDRIFLADTARDTLGWLDSDGRVLDEVRKGFRFPNQVALDGDALLVANTNHHEITRIPLRDGRFAPPDQWQHLPVDGDVASSSGHVWPVEMVTVGEERFVLQMGSGMKNGIVFRYGIDGAYRGRFTMPADSDALGLVFFRGALLVADPGSMAVWRYAPDGNMSGRFTAPALASYLQHLTQQRDHYRALERRWWWSFGLLLAAGFGLAVVGEQRAQRKRREEAVAGAHATLVTMAQQGESMQPAADDPAIHWLAHDERRLRSIRLVGIAGMLLLLLVPLLEFSTRYAGNSEVTSREVLLPVGLMSVLMVLLLAAAVWLIQRALRNTRIGVLREWVILRNAQGRTAVGRGADIALLPNAIAIGKVVVSIGPRTPGELPARSLFDVLALQQWLAPRLLQAQEINGLALLGWYFRLQPLQSWALVLALLALAGWHLLG